MSIRRVNYRSWLLRIVTWDTLLPACVGLLPHGIELVFPKNRGVMEVVAVTVPVAAFFLRIRAGTHQIATNQCSQILRNLQRCAFVLGILPLVLVDAFLILSHLMPQGALIATPGDRLVWAIVLGVYLTCMAVAMYPGAVGADASEGHFADIDAFRDREGFEKWTEPITREMDSPSL